MLAGQSAGGWDVETLLAVPAAQGLFSVAGDESGPVPAGRLPDLPTLEAADQSFVAAAGCSAAADVLACMRAVPANTIVNLQTGYHFYSAIASQFLPADPFLALQQNGSPVPLLIGSNRTVKSLLCSKARIPGSITRHIKRPSIEGVIRSELELPTRC